MSDERRLLSPVGVVLVNARDCYVAAQGSDCPICPYQAIDAVAPDLVVRFKAVIAMNHHLGCDVCVWFDAGRTLAEVVAAFNGAAMKEGARG